MFQPRLINDNKLSKQYNLEYNTILQEALFTRFEKLYKTPEVPLLLKKENEIIDKYSCHQCSDIFYHATSLDEHISRGSWILGYWCKHCFNECEHFSRQKRNCFKCNKIQRQKYIAMRIRGLIDDIDPGVVKIFFNPCQLLQHMRIHNMKEISIHQLMLLPFPSGISTEYFPHLKMISEALMDFMFLKNIHIADWLWQNKIHKWWKMAKGDNPVANIIKKYPFEVYQIKKLLNSNTKLNLDSRLDNDYITKKKFFTNSSTKPISTISNCNTSIPAIHVEKPTGSLELLNKKICQFTSSEQNNNRGTTLNFSSTNENSQDINSLSEVSKNNISVKQFAKIKNLSLVENGRDARVILHKQTYSNKNVPKIINGTSTKSSQFTAFKKSTELSQKVKDKKIIFIRKRDQINKDTCTKLKQNSQKLSIIKFNKVQFLKNSKTARFQGLESSNLSTANSQDEQIETINQIHQLINESDSVALNKQIIKFYSGTKSQTFENSNEFSKNNSFPLILKESISNIPPTDDNSIFVTSNISTKNILEQLFNKEDLKFLTLTKSEQGKSFLAILKNISFANNLECKQEMLASLSKINKSKIYFKISHIQSLSKRYSEKFDVLNDEIIEGHKHLISILENIAKNIELSMQSTENYFSLSSSAASGITCSTCHQVMRSPEYLIGFFEPLSEINYCLCYDFICFKCNMFQGNKERFNSHLKYHEFEYPYTCPECKLEFPSSQNLEVHLWTKCFHQFAMHFLCCTICEIGGFCSAEAIINHFIIMHSQKMSVCSLCCMAFEYKRHCINHIKKHHSEVKHNTEPLQLILCQLDYRIMPIEHFNDHVMSHKCIQEITHYFCNLCFNKTIKFKTLESIKLHAYKYHLPELSNVISENSLKEILSMEDIQLIFKKQVRNNSCVGLEAAIDYPVTAVSINNVDDNSKEKYHKLQAEENRQSILAINASIFTSCPDHELNNKKYFKYSNKFIRNNPSLQVSNTKRSANDYSNIQSENFFKILEMNENVTRKISKSSNYTEKKVLRTESEDILKVLPKKKHQNITIDTNNFLTLLNKRTNQKANMVSKHVDVNIVGISNGIILQFNKNEEKLSEKANRSYDLCNKYNLDCFNVNNLNFFGEKIIERHLSQHIPSNNILTENNDVEKYVLGGTAGKIPLNCQSHVYEDIVNDKDEEFHITCTYPHSGNNKKRRDRSNKSGDTCQQSNFFSRKNTIILSNENIKQTAIKSISYYDEKERLINNTIENMNPKSLNDNVNSTDLKISYEKCSNTNENNGLKLLESRKTLKEYCDSSQSLLSASNTSDCESPDYFSKLKNSYENEKLYEINHLNNEHVSVNCEENIPLRKSTDDIDIKNHSLKKNVNVEKVIEYNHVKITSNLRENIELDNRHKVDYYFFEKSRMDGNSNIESEIEKASCMMKNKNIDSLRLHVKQSKSIPLNNVSSTWEDENIENISTRKSNVEILLNKMNVGNRKHKNISSESIKSISDYGIKFNENYISSTKQVVTPNITKIRDLHSNISFKNLLIKTQNYKKVDNIQDSLKIPKSYMPYLESKEEMNFPSRTKITNLPLTDDEKINMSKISHLEVNKIKFTDSKRLAINDKKLRPRICNKINIISSTDLRKRKSVDAAIQKYSEKNNTIFKKQVTTINYASIGNRKLIHKSLNNSKFNKRFKHIAALLQRNALNKEKVISQSLKRNESLSTKRNLKKRRSYLIKNDDAQIKYTKLKEEMVQPLISLPMFLKTSRQQSNGKTCKASHSKVVNKNRIGFFNNERDMVKICEFKCHLCKDSINTDWRTLHDHYTTKHSENYDIYTISLKLFPVSENYSNEKININTSKKRKSTEILNTGLKKKKRRNTKKMTEKFKVTIDRTSGLYVQPEPIIDEKGNFKCKKCEERCTNMTDLRRHIYNNHRISKKNLICLECGENFVVSPSLQMHLKAFHEIDDPNTYMNTYYAPLIDFETKYEVKVANQCHVCMTVFKDKLAVDKHLRVHGMAFLNKKRIEARKAELVSTKKQDNNYIELDTRLKLIEKDEINLETTINVGSTEVAS